MAKASLIESYHANKVEVEVSALVFEASQWKNPYGRRGGCFRGLYEVSLALVGVAPPA